MKRFIKIITVIILVATAVFFLYCNNTALANKKTLAFYNELKDSLQSKGYKASLLVISTKRFGWHNYIQRKFTHAAKKSRHLSGDAIDFLVFDINSNGISDSADVNIVTAILDRSIVKNLGGLGTYKTDKGFLNQQMVHIDCRGYGARWNY
jgi:uncharacterized protein YcbK (DUF882 family)